MLFANGSSLPQSTPHRSDSDMGAAVKDLLAPRFIDDDASKPREVDESEPFSNDIDNEQESTDVDFERTPTMVGREITPTDDDKSHFVEEPQEQEKPILIERCDQDDTLADTRSNSIDSNTSNSSQYSASTTSDESDIFIPRAPMNPTVAGRPKPKPKPTIKK